MILAVPLLFLGALMVVEQDMTFDNSDSWQYLAADLDGDGQRDLVFPTQICFQRNRLFPADARVPTPGAKEKAHIDIFGERLYVRFEERLAVYRRENGEWRAEHEQAIPWPSPTPADKLYNEPSADGAVFERFLGDLDADGVPELVLPGENGLHIYRNAGAGYAEVSRLDVFPPVQLQTSGWELWPPGARRLAYPTRSVNFSYVLDGSRLTIVTPEDRREDMTRLFHAKRFQIDPAQNFAAVPEPNGEETSEPVTIRSWYIKPRFMNDDDPLDYGGSDVNLSGASLLAPLHDTFVTTEAGKPMRRFRTEHMNAGEPFVDFNHDGRKDVVTWSTDLFNSGLRESVNRVLGGRQVVDEIRVYFQDAQGAFPETPDVTGKFTIQFDKPPALGGGGEYGRGRSSDLSGDFNGDGRNDAAVGETPDGVSVYLCEGATFANAPAFTASRRDDDERFHVRDVDGDGRADIATDWYERQGDSSVRHRRVFLTREGTK